MRTLRKRLLSLVLIVSVFLTISAQAFAADSTMTGKAFAPDTALSAQVYVVDATNSATSSSTSANCTSTIGDYLQGVIDIIKQKYNGEVTDQKLIEAAIKGMTEALDPYSTYFTQEEFDAYYNTFQGSVEGIGVQVIQDGDYVQIIKAFPGSSAMQAGILPGDKIFEVDGINVVGKQLEDVVSKVKGQPGTKVKLGILRSGTKKYFEIVRAKISVPSVSSDIRGDIGYIKIDSFTETTATGVNQALSAFDKKKITKVVLDLRDNGGGLVDAAVSVAQNFIPKGVVTTLKFKDPTQQDITYTSSLEKLKYKVAVLVNQNSASASEILTGAIKDTKAGVVIGTKTFGKSKVQTFTPIITDEAFNKYNTDGNLALDPYINGHFTNVGGWIKLTTGMYYTPNGESIDLKGIEPNIKVDNYKVESIDVNSIDQLTAAKPLALNAESIDVLNAEAILKLLNYSVDTPDVKLDTKTQDALKKFQKDAKINVTGKLDITSQQLLNNKLNALKLKIDTQYSRAVQELNKK